MTTFTRLAIIAGAITLLAACKKQKQQEATQETVVNVQEEVRSLMAYEQIDSLVLGNHKIIYTIISEPDDSLPLITDEDGVQYKDNCICLEIVKDGNTLFCRYFTKADFNASLSADFRKHGIMDGLRFSHIDDGKYYFNACVSLPDSDMSCPFLLIVGPDGSYAITPDTSVPEDEVPCV